ncbi:hypothetical protein SKAU_G00354310 [Synaphobranchus kaupii]|uniref:Uncharacterized protein n=1 Tax=Synaphobranchus kaupii TaxID=118154 RepID=A0A9Q1EH15_SYNKA|nr:hypothetical protein SKAU_G00354310 [Synaphobranchus kaupii]
MDPGQDLLLAALSESGISANDLFDIEPPDTGPPPAQQSVPISTLDIGPATDAAVTVRQQPVAPPTPTFTIRQKPQPSTTTFVLNQLNQLPSLGTIVVTKPSVGGSTSRQTITVAKVVHSARPSATATVRALSAPGREQIQLKDLLKTGSIKTSSLGELMKLKPPPNIAQPVATATKIILVSTKLVNKSGMEDVGTVGGWYTGLWACPPLQGPCAHYPNMHLKG